MYKINYILYISNITLQFITMDKLVKSLKKNRTLFCNK